MKKFLLTILALILTVGIASSHQYQNDFFIMGEDGPYVDARTYATLAAAVAAVGADVVTIKIFESEAAGTLTIHANTTLEFVGDGGIVVATQLTINTLNIIASAHQIFSGAGDIDFADGTVVKSSWFSNLDEAMDVTNDDTLTILITESETLTADAAVGDDVVLRWESQFLLTNGGFTVSNIKKIEAGTYQIFSSGAGDWDYLAGSVIKSSWHTNLRIAIAFTSDENVNLTILVDQPETIDANTTIDIYQSLVISKGNIVSVETGDTFIVDGPLLAGEYQIFNLIGTGVVDLSSMPKPIVYPEWMGYIDGTNDEVQINAAINTLRKTGITAKTAANKKIASNFLRKVVRLTGNYYIDTPILCESEEDSNIEADNIILDGMGVGRITMNSGFTGVERYYDTTADGHQTIVAAILMGGRDFGKDGGNPQVYSGVKRLQIFGVPTAGITQTAQIGIWDEYSHRNEYEDLYFEALGYGIKARSPVNVSINNIKARRCPSVVTVYFDVPDIRAEGDYGGSWVAADEANDVNITNVYTYCDPTLITDDATTAALSLVHLYNIGEYKLDRITLFGGFHGLTIDNLDGTSHGWRWGSVDNLEIAQTQGYGLKVADRSHFHFGQVEVTWSVWNSLASANVDYTEAHVQFTDCTDFTVDQLSIDRNYNIANMTGGHSLTLDGCLNAAINSFRSFGIPGQVDDTYSHITFVDTDYSYINNIMLGISYNASYLFKYGLILDNDSSNNSFRNFQYYDYANRVKTAQVSFGTASGNSVESSVPQITSTDEGGTIDVTGLKALNIENTGAQVVTNFTSGYKGQSLIVTFNDTNTTLQDVDDVAPGFFELDTGTTFNPASNKDTIFFILKGTSWQEISQSSN